MNVKQEFLHCAKAVIAFVAAGCAAGSDIGGPGSTPATRAPSAVIETSISVFDLAAGTGLYGRAYHVNAAGYVLGTLGTDPISPKGFGDWAPLSSRFNLIDATVGSTDIGDGNAAGDWAEHYDFPRVWLISAENSWTPATLAPLGTSAGTPAAINAGRVVVGRTSLGAVRWPDPYSAPALLPLPAIPGIDASSSQAWGINSNGP
jgi:hypothetical protein